MTEDLIRLRRRMLDVIEAYETRCKVLTTLAAGVIPKGYTLTPTTPDIHMVMAAQIGDGSLAEMVYQRMLAARPMWSQIDGEKVA